MKHLMDQSGESIYFRSVLTDLHINLGKKCNLIAEGTKVMAKKIQK